MCSQEQPRADLSAPKDSELFPNIKNAPHAVHLFSGPAERSDGLRKAFRDAGWTTTDIDTANAHLHGDSHSNLLRDDLWIRIQSALDEGRIDAVIAGPPCSTFSRARHGGGSQDGPRPLRSPEHPYGLRGVHLHEHEKNKVKEANYLALKILETLRLAHTKGVAFVLEQPAPSPGVASMYHFEEAKALRALPGVTAVALDQCMFGAASTKPTLLVTYCVLTDGLDKKCVHVKQRQDYFDASGAPLSRWGAHAPLRGPSADGSFKTAAAAAYPAELNLTLAQRITSQDRRATPGTTARAPAQAVARVEGVPVDRPTALRGPQGISKKARAEIDNHAAIGGMRTPHEAAHRLPQLRSTLSAIRPAIIGVLDKHPSTYDCIQRILGGRPHDGFSDAATRDLKVALRRALGLSQAGEIQGLDPDVFEALHRRGDPDPHLSEWLRSGAPLGTVDPVPHAGIFPDSHWATRDRTDTEALTTPLEGWSNYRSAELEPEVAEGLLEKMVSQGWACACDSADDARDLVGHRDLVLNKLALITKHKPEGVKHRLVWDLRRSGVNATIQQSERIVLPRLNDVIGDARDLWSRNRHRGDTTRFLAIDISNAFHIIPLARHEWRFTIAAILGKYYVFKVLVFGSSSAPTVWGRYAAFLGRTTASIVDRSHVRVEIFVDDPLYIARGSQSRIASELTLAVGWAVALGYPLAWSKASGGDAVTWIGATISAAADAVSISVPPGKVLEATAMLADLHGSGYTTAQQLASLAGKLSFFSGLVPTMRPFLSTLWAALYSDRDAQGGALPPGAASAPWVENRRRRIPLRRIKHGVAWFRAFFEGRRGTLTRTVPFDPQPSEFLELIVDACPWGIGGVEVLPGGRFGRWFAQPLLAEDLQIFNARIGDSAYNTLWEGLALLVGIRLFRLEHRGTRVALRSDSLSSLLAISRGAARSRSLNVIVAELALLRAEQALDIVRLTHVPGVANIVADALSRQAAPGPPPLPRELQAETRLTPPPRPRAWWATLDVPGSPLKSA